MLYLLISSFWFLTTPAYMVVCGVWVPVFECVSVRACDIVMFQDALPDNNDQQLLTVFHLGKLRYFIIHLSHIIW